ncbi:MAG: hypothetical protein M1818_008132 [Claussenomyces sp. TS43310]|nr:MAG: hypothetical protein M1818_008132 [Claussenomyces sp. TS43310]
MGTFVFKWEHPASEVYVTGTFDNWSQSEKLEKIGDIFEKDVTLSDASEKIYYKFVVDGTWTTDHTAPQENDASGNLNNVLTTDRIKKHTPGTAGILSGVVPTSTTATLAKDAPLEKTSGSSDLPGSFPETPATEPAAFSVNPIPATDGPGNPVKLAPGEPVPDPSALTSNKITSTVHDDTSLPSEQTFGVDPIPATAGTGNPITLAAGEPVPHHSNFTANSVESTATTDKASYENSSGSAPVLPPVVTPQTERDSKGAGVFDLPPISQGIIPESSLPMGEPGAGSYDASPLVHSAAPTSTTAQLAASVPLEKKAEVPEVVKESQQEAGFAPEASAIPGEVREKSVVEKELLSEVPKAKVTSDGTVTEAPIKAATSATDNEPETAGAAGIASFLPESVQQSINSINAASGQQSIAGNVPEEVKESIAESGASPEAAANSEQVADKKAVEKELLSEIEPEQSSGEPAPKAEGLNAPAEAEAITAPAKPTVDSRDVSPGTTPGTHTQTEPVVTTGVKSAPTAETSAAAPPTTPSKATTSPSKPAESPASSANGSSAAADAKKKKRNSIFGKLKAKFSDKDKK